MLRCESSGVAGALGESYEQQSESGSGDDLHVVHNERKARHDQRRQAPRNVADKSEGKRVYDTGSALVGFGWAFRVGERFEIRPEALLYLGRGSYMRAGITGWFRF